MTPTNILLGVLTAALVAVVVAVVVVTIRRLTARAAGRPDGEDAPRPGRVRGGHGSRTSGRLRRAALHCARTPGFLGHFCWLFLKANAAVAREIVTSGSTLAPAVVELRLQCRTPLETATLAHLICLTPGTLVLEVRAEPSTLFVHGMHAADPELFLNQLRDLERRLLAVMQPTGDDNV